MSPSTEAALAEVRRAAAAGQQTIAPVTFSHCFGRAAASAAFRMARKEGIIEVAYIGGTGSPVYRAAGVGAAIVEAATASRH